MRDIKFRAWNGDMMSEPFRPWQLHDDGTSITAPDGVSVHWAGFPYTWMQYTGLKDRTGREIYEGDVLEFDADEWGDTKGNRQSVEWSRYNGWIAIGLPSEWDQYCQIIGNIYENPELLK